MRKPTSESKLQLDLINSLNTIACVRRRMDHIIASATSSADIADQIDMCNVLLSQISAVTENIGCRFAYSAPECARLTQH